MRTREEMLIYAQQAIQDPANRILLNDLVIKAMRIGVQFPNSSEVLSMACGFRKHSNSEEVELCAEQYQCVITIRDGLAYLLQMCLVKEQM